MNSKRTKLPSLSFHRTSATDTITNKLIWHSSAGSSIDATLGTAVCMSIVFGFASSFLDFVAHRTNPVLRPTKLLCSRVPVEPESLFFWRMRKCSGSTAGLGLPGRHLGVLQLPHIVLQNLLQDWALDPEMSQNLFPLLRYEFHVVAQPLR